MTRSLIPLLQLIRLPNVLTAAADSLAGWLLVGGSLGEAGRWLPLAIASMVLYAAGMALNDVFDARDRPAGAARTADPLRAGLAVGSPAAWGPSVWSSDHSWPG